MTSRLFSALHTVNGDITALGRMDQRARPTKCLGIWGSFWKYLQLPVNDLHRSKDRFLGDFNSNRPGIN